MFTLVHNFSARQQFLERPNKNPDRRRQMGSIGIRERREQSGSPVPRRHIPDI